MKIYIHTDIEGVAGWVFYATLSNGSIWNYEHTQRMNRLLTAEVNAAVRACKAMGATDVLVNDAHGWAYNLNFEELDPICRVMHGRQGYAPSWVPLLDETVDAAIAIGQHAMAATPGAVCPHSYWHLTDGVGRKWALSEATMFAALAGTKGVPLVAVSGDDKIAAEVTEKIPGCEAAVVKLGLGAQNACTLMPAAAHARIEAAVRKGLARRDEIAPLVLKGPFKLNLSNRDPAKRELEKDTEGDDLWTLMHDTCRVFGNRWGDQTIDDGSYRYPAL